VSDQEGDPTEGLPPDIARKSQEEWDRKETTGECRYRHNVECVGHGRAYRLAKELKAVSARLREAEARCPAPGCWNLRLTLGTIYVTWEARDCSHDPFAPCILDEDRTDESMCDRCWLMELIEKSLPEPALSNTIQEMAALAEEDGPA
jgi:hypothetical protein